MITSLILFLSLSVSAPVSAAQAPACEAHSNGVTGITVTVCAGSVVKACDASGNCHGPVASY